jgi:hypothetical protein
MGRQRQYHASTVAHRGNDLFSRPATACYPEQAVPTGQQKGLSIAGLLSGNPSFSPISEFEHKHRRLFRAKDAGRSLKYSQLSSFDVDLDDINLVDVHFRH